MTTGIPKVAEINTKLKSTRREMERKHRRDILALQRIRVLHSQFKTPKLTTVHGIRHLELTFEINDNWIGYEFVQGPTVSFSAGHITEDWITEQYGTLAEMMREIEMFESNV